MRLDSKHFTNIRDRNAIFCNGEMFTYKQLFKHSKGIRDEVLSSPDEIFGVFTDNNFYTYATILGIYLANKTFVPLNHKFPQERLVQIISSTGMNKVFGNGESKSKIQDLGVHYLNNELEKDIDLDDDKLYDASKKCYILFTSGSTGEPKGIPILFKNLDTLTDSIFTSLPMDQDDKVLQTFELSFDVSLACSFMAWSKGACLYLSPLDGIIAVNAFKTVLDNKVNWVCIAPSAITYLKKLKLLRDYPLPFVTKTIFTGEALPIEFAMDWKKCATNSDVYNAYGPTENTVWSFVHRISEKSTFENGLVPIGSAVEGFKFKLKEDELWVAGDQVFHGYLKNETKTNEVLIKENGTTWYRTGDIVNIQKSGDVMYLNRVDNQIQINGYRVELGEVEFKIKKQMAVQNCCVFFDKEKNLLTAVVERNQVVGKDEIKLINEILPFYMQPKGYKNLNQFPLNSNSKIDRIKIKEMIG